MAVTSHIDTVLFDFAGTLLMPRPPEELVEAAATGLGLSLRAADLAALSAEYLRVGLPGAPYPASVPPQLAELYAGRDVSSAAHRAAYVGLLETVDSPDERLPQATYEQILRPESWVAYADAVDVVDRLLARGVRVGVLSNVGFDIRPILREHGFAALAEHCTLSFELGVTKPSPEIFLAALEDLGATPEQTLMVGDNPSADAAAVNIGCRTLLLPMSEPGAVQGLAAVLRLLPPQPGDLLYELTILSVADVDRAKAFYADTLGWTVDVDHRRGESFRVVQVTPPGSAASVSFGTGISSGEPGSSRGMHLVTTDIEHTFADLRARGVDVTEPYHFGASGQTPGVHPERLDYGTFLSFSDPDGNGWVVQEVPTRRPGR